MTTNQQKVVRKKAMELIGKPDILERKVKKVAQGKKMINYGKWYWNFQNYRNWEMTTEFNTINW